MAEVDKDSKTEEPTPRRREDARQDDQVPESMDVNTVAVLVAAFGVSFWAVPALIEGQARNIGAWIKLAGSAEVTPETIGGLLGQMVAQVATLSMPFVVATIAAGVAAQIAQTGFKIRPDRLKLKMGSINPLKGLKTLVSADSVVKLGKSALKLSFAGYIAYRVIVKSGAGAEMMVGVPVPYVLEFLGHALARTVGWILMALIVLAVIDYAYTYWKVEKNLKMSKQEVKDDERAEMGDVQMKRKFFSMHQKLSRNRMLSAVPTADVLVTNPVHLAVALRYDAEKMRAPQVVAKGADHLAEHMKTAARRAGVPILERRALARALFRSVRVGQEVPAALYRAVAEVLAYIYSLRRGTAAAASGAAR